jgi:hypothetical protein
VFRNMVDGVDVKNRTKRLFILNWTVVSGNGRYPRALANRSGGHINYLAVTLCVETRLQQSTQGTAGVSRIQVSTIFAAAIRL